VNFLGKYNLRYFMVVIISTIFIMILHALSHNMIFGRLFVKRFALCYQTVVCLSLLPALSVTLVYCGQTVGRIKMKLGMQVGLALATLC